MLKQSWNIVGDGITSEYLTRKNELVYSSMTYLPGERSIPDLYLSARMLLGSQENKGFILFRI